MIGSSVCCSRPTFGEHTVPLRLGMFSRGEAGG